MSNPFDVAQKYLTKTPKPMLAPTVERPTIDHIIDDRTIAVLIDSTVLGAPLWFAFDPAFDPGDRIPVFYADELAMLKDKPVSTLRKIYETKKSCGIGYRVRQ
jgi:hypothetical protein